MDRELYLLESEKKDKKLIHEYREDYLESIMQFARIHDYDFIAAGNYKGK